MPNEPKKHHYVPQFYMRRFALNADANKVMTLERHRDLVVAAPKSIDGIGFEDHLHDYDLDGRLASIEGDMNTAIETPFSRCKTWRKISSGQSESLDQSDRFPIYGFARHLQRRNVATLRFIDSQHARYQAGELEGELTNEERAYHAWLAESPGAAHETFRAGAMDTMLPDDADAINVMICHAPIPLRTSTNPTLTISFPGHQSIFGPMFNSLKTWWLTLDPHCGALIIAGGPPGFSSSAIPAEIAQVINRRYLTQFLLGDARYILADDDLIQGDLEWAGFVLDKRTTHGFRYRKPPVP